MKSLARICWVEKHKTRRARQMNLKLCRRNENFTMGDIRYIDRGGLTGIDLLYISEVTE